MIIYRPITVLLNAISVGARKTINFITGSNTTLDVSDNQAQDRIDVTVTGLGAAIWIGDTAPDPNVYPLWIDTS